MGAGIHERHISVGVQCVRGADLNQGREPATLQTGTTARNRIKK